MSIALPAFFAGLVAIVATVAIERWGGRVGGILATLPTTIVPASIAFHRQSDPTGFVDAMMSVPPGMLLNLLFLYLWRVLPTHLPRWRLGLRLALMTLISLSAWLASAIGFAYAMEILRQHQISTTLVGLASTVIIILVGGAASWKPYPAPRAQHTVGAISLIARGLLAAAAIGGAIWLADHAGQIIAGVASVFPAIFLTTMVSLWLAQGEAVPAGAVGPMMIGSTSVALYSAYAALLMPHWGSLAGTIASWIAAVATGALPAAAWLKSRRQPRGAIDR